MASTNARPRNKIIRTDRKNPKGIPSEFEKLVNNDAKKSSKDQVFRTMWISRRNIDVCGAEDFGKNPDAPMLSTLQDEVTKDTIFCISEIPQQKNFSHAKKIVEKNLKGISKNFHSAEKTVKISL